MLKPLHLFCWGNNDLHISLIAAPHCHIAFCYLLTSEAQILYKCNYDSTGSTNNCLLAPGIFAILVTDKLGTIGSPPPNTPLSDVTSSRNSHHINRYLLHHTSTHLSLLVTPTNNGLPCSLPYRVGSFTWDMYFCNNGFCPTATNNNTQCRPGSCLALASVHSSLIV